MNQALIPEETRRFVLTSVPSVPFLEALLLLRADPGKPWTKDALARRLYIRDRVAETLLHDLCTAGMAARCAPPDQASYHYHPSSELLRSRIDNLADLYSKHRAEVTRLFHSSLDGKATQFADAFKLQKDS